MRKRLAVTLCSAVAFAAYACPVSMRAQSQNESNSQASSTSQQTTNTGGQNSQDVSAQSTNNGSQTGTSSTTENGTSYRNSQKQNDNWQQGSNADANSPAAKQEAKNLVPAEATLTQTLDAKNAQTGQQISAKLQDQVQLKNGPELPKGTVLQGKVTADHVKPDSVRMAIRFDEAKLSDGQTVPIKATVVGVARPQSDFQNSSQMNRNNGSAYASQNGTTGQMNGNNSTTEANQNGATGQMNGSNNSAEASQNGTTGQMNGSNSTAEANQNGATGQMNGSNSTAEANQNNSTGQMNQSSTTAQSNLPASTAYAATWTPNTLQVDQVNVISGVDLHSRIHSKNSAVFVSQSKNDLRLDQGSQLTLAIGKQQSQNYSGNNVGSPSL